MKVVIPPLVGGIGPTSRTRGRKDDIPISSRRKREFLRFPLEEPCSAEKNLGYIKPLPTNSRNRPNHEFFSPRREPNWRNRELREFSRTDMLPRNLAIF